MPQTMDGSTLASDDLEAAVGAVVSVTAYFPNKLYALGVPRESKEEARSFLVGLEQFLNARIPSRDFVHARVEEEVHQAKLAQGTRRNRYISSREGAFFKLFGVEAVNQYLQESPSNLSADEARQAVLSESYRHFRHLASNSPRSLKKNPFTKNAGENTHSIVVRWWEQKSGMQQSCPDLALRPPCPYRIVIEGKYFRKGGMESARTELVRDIYQCFFYRGLPTALETKTHPAWDYEYSCLMAYDGSENGNLFRAWKDLQHLNKTVAEGLWDGANIFVIVIRGEN